MLTAARRLVAITVANSSRESEIRTIIRIRDPLNIDHPSIAVYLRNSCSPGLPEVVLPAFGHRAFSGDLRSEGSFPRSGTGLDFILEPCSPPLARLRSRQAKLLKCSLRVPRTSAHVACRCARRRLARRSWEGVRCQQQASAFRWGVRCCGGVGGARLLRTHRHAGQFHCGVQTGDGVAGRFRCRWSHICIGGQAPAHQSSRDLCGAGDARQRRVTNRGLRNNETWTKPWSW